jgi:uncharacterized protein
MEMSKTCTIPASVEATWEALNDPLFLKDCITGCESIERVGDNDFKVLLAAKVGPVNARFAGRMLLDDLDPPTAYSIRFEGQGGAAGFAKGRARVTLERQDGNVATLMSYEVQAQVGGKLAQVGSRLIDGAARKVADDFFAAFIEKISPQPLSGPSEVVDAVASQRRGWSGRQRWSWALAALVALVAAMGWFLATRAT